jgi:formylglycine-generating enzyme
MTIRRTSWVLVAAAAAMSCDAVLGIQQYADSVSDAGVESGADGVAGGGDGSPIDGAETGPALDGSPDGGGHSDATGNEGDASDAGDAIVLPDVVCSPDAQPQCVGSSVATCTSGGTLTSWPCATGTCHGGACTGTTTTATSCQATGPGLTDCPGEGGPESCCTSLEVPGGTFDRTYENTGNGPLPGATDPATVSGFRLDKYLVTVGRFRRFMNVLDGGAGAGVPEGGSGKQTHLNGEAGLENGATGTFETGWLATDDSKLALEDSSLSSCGTTSTWTHALGTQEPLPIDCVSWYQAYAFCIWDGGFLPSEAEWEYAAAGGSQQRLYPWGSADPGSGATSYAYAIYATGAADAGCLYPAPGSDCNSVSSIAPVGTPQAGAALWGQLDMGGELWEWNLDVATSAYPNPCKDCATLPEDGGASSDRWYPGGAFDRASDQLMLPPQYFYSGPPDLPEGNVGFRCARSP